MSTIFKVPVLAGMEVTNQFLFPRRELAEDIIGRKENRIECKRKEFKIGKEMLEEGGKRAAEDVTETSCVDGVGRQEIFVYNTNGQKTQSKKGKELIPLRYI